MISPAHLRLMAAYNAWQNDSLLAACDGLDVAARRLDRGAFFSSIERTFRHILWADQLWMKRFGVGTGPEIMDMTTAMAQENPWAEFITARRACDAELKAFAQGLTDDALAGDLTWYSGVAKRNMSKPRWVLLTHVFNHQTHHRGQIHAMLTAAGRRPDDTDIPFMPDRYTENM